MNNLPDNLIIEMFKNLDIKSAIRLSETSKRHHSILNNPHYGLWEFYLNRDFPQAAKPLNRDFKTAYVQLHLRAAVNRLNEVVDFILIPSTFFNPLFRFNNLNQIRALKARVSAITEQTTVPQLTKLLLDLKRGVSANYISTRSGTTPLSEAAAQGNTAIAQALIQAGANVNAVDEDGNTPLYLAAEWGKTAIAQALIQAGANVNAADEYGHTPLHHAALRGYLAIAQALIQAGANVNAVDEDGKTPLCFARRGRYGQTIKLLEGVIHFRSTVKPMLISKAIEIQERNNRLVKNGNTAPNRSCNVM